MSMAFRGQPQYAQSPMGGYNMSGYGGDVMQAFGDIGGLGGFANYGAVSGPASLGGSYSMFGSYNPMPFPQQSYTGGYVPGYGSQLPQQFGGGYGQGYGNMYGAAPGGGFGFGFGNIGMPQMQQPNVNDLFGQYMFGQYYGQPAFNPFQATSMFGGQRGRGGFGGGRRGGRERFQQPPQMSNPGRFGPVQQPLMPTPPLETAEPAPIIYDTMPFNPRQFPIDTPTPTPAPVPAAPDKNQDPNYWYSVFKESNPGVDDARLRELADSRAATFRNTPASQPAQPAQPTQPAAPAGLYDTSKDDWGRGEGPIDASQLPSGFNWQAYLDAPSNADLRAAGVDTPSEAARHYLKYGRNENRTLGAAPTAQASTPTPTPATTQPYSPYYPQQYEQTMPYSFGPINMGSLPMFVDSYAGLYNNPFSFR